MDEITQIEYFTEEELISCLRGVTMLEDPHCYPYADAEIQLAKITHENLNPAQRYILTENIGRVQHLQWAIEENGFNIFQLNGFLRMRFDGSDEQVDLLPPVVEVSDYDDPTRDINIVCDGMHRIYLSYVQWIVPQVILIRNVPRQYPYYAYPLKNPSWDAIEIWENIPKDSIKKWHRIEENKKLYRNFNSTFKNVGAPRGTGE